jgi:hypothetical protein
MNISFRLFQTLVLYVAVNLLLAITWHLVLFRDVLAGTAPFARAEPIIPLGMAAMVLHGVLLIAVYPHFHRQGSRARAGVLFGATVGLFLAAGAIWVDVGKFEFHNGPTYLLLETVYEVFSFSILGALIAFRHKAEEPSLTHTQQEPTA